jgi:KaiC/GvpD/RAD55 family RecA-like ATPase
MGTAVRLPGELTDFLQLPGPQSLLIRGPPGSGKTTLGLALLEHAAGVRILVSNRVSGDELAREFPWLGKDGSSKIQIVNTTDLQYDDAAKTKKAASRMLETGPKDRVELSEFLALPAAIQKAWSQLPSSSPSTVVIDSWDALIEHALGEGSPGADGPRDRAEIERTLLRWMGRAPTHLVLVLETDSQTQLDYLVNGVAVTRRELVNDRLERWLHLPKLRGIRIANGAYPYTVEGAKFQCIEPLRPYTEIHRGHIDPKPDDMPGFIWPGSRSFAEAFGRLALGRVTVIEVDDEVPDYVVQHLLTPPKIQTVTSGGRVMVIPSPSLTADDIFSPIEDAHASGRLSDLFRVLDVTGQLTRATRGGHPERFACLMPTKDIAPPDPSADPEDNEISRWLAGGVRGGAPSLATLYETGMEALGVALKVPITPESTRVLASSIQSSLVGQNHHVVAVGRINSPLLQPIRALASIHLRLTDRQGRELIYGLKPWTTGFVLTESRGSGPYDLLRIV